LVMASSRPRCVNQCRASHRPSRPWTQVTVERGIRPVGFQIPALFQRSTLPAPNSSLSNCLRPVCRTQRRR